MLTTHLTFPENLSLFGILPLGKSVADYKPNINLTHEMVIVNWKLVKWIFLLHKICCWRKFGYSILPECKPLVMVPLRVQAQWWNGIFFVITIRLIKLTVSSQRLWHKTVQVTSVRYWKGAKDLIDIESELPSSLRITMKGLLQVILRHISVVIWQSLHW